MRSVWSCATLLSLGFIPTHLQAADIALDATDAELAIITIGGDIRRGDAEVFRREAAKVSNAVIVLESSGGATLEAIEIGEAIRLRGFSTLVMNETTCASACALIWLAGSPRALSQSARVGFHATYIDDRGSRFESGVGNALVGRYLGALNLPQKAIVFATTASPDNMHWLGRNNAGEAGIEIKFVDDFDFDNEEPVPEPPPIRTTRVDPKSEITQWSIQGDWTISSDHTLGDSCFAMKTFSDGTTFRVGLDLRFKGGSYIILGNREWASLEVGKEYPITLRFDENDDWDSPTSAIEIGGQKALYVTFDDNQFWRELSNSNMLRISRNDVVFASMFLAKSAEAVEDVIECQKTWNLARKQRDPFAD